MRLIDADEVVCFPNLPSSGYEDTLQDLIGEHIPDDLQIDYEEELMALCKAATNAVLNVVKTSPTVDAEPVVNAHWERGDFFVDPNGHEMNGCLDGYWFRRCSNCRGGYTSHHRYCPNCGARMDEEADSNARTLG